MSGAGRIKGDMDRDNICVEVKDTLSRYTLDAVDLYRQFSKALTQGFDGWEFVVQFHNPEVRVRCVIEHDGMNPWR